MMDRRVLRRGALLFLLLLAFAVRIAGLTVQSLWRDEVDALRFSQASPATLVSNFTRVGWNGPLYYVFLRSWVAVTGGSEFSLRYFSLGMGVVGVALIYRLGREWFSRSVGAVAALLMASSPYMVWYGQETKMYALVCALALATIHVYHRALTEDDVLTWIGVPALGWATMGVHVMGVLIVPVMALLCGVWWPSARARWRQALLVLSLTVAPALVALPWAGPLLLRGGDIGHRWVPLPGMVKMMLHAFSRGILPGELELPMMLALFCLLAGSVLWEGDSLAPVWARFRGTRTDLPESAKRERAHVLALWVWMAVPLLGLYAISLRVPMFVDRYLIWIGPAFLTLAARGLEQVRRRSTIVWACCLVLMLWLNGHGVMQQSTVPIKSDFRAAANYVLSHREPDQLILFHISYVRHTFEYYYGDASPYADGIPTDGATTETTVDLLMRERTAGHEVIWLVLSEPDMWDQRGMTVAWLDAHAKAETRADFKHVSVIRYRLAR